jgi:hypothetical protein
MKKKSNPSTLSHDGRVIHMIELMLKAALRGEVIALKAMTIDSIGREKHWVVDDSDNGAYWHKIIERNG